MTNIGRVIYGYCNGYFGRDSYSDKRIEAEGFDWIVARERNNSLVFTTFPNSREKQALIDDWAVSESDDEDY